MDSTTWKSAEQAAELLRTGTVLSRLTYTTLVRDPQGRLWNVEQMPRTPLMAWPA